jgi:hypothetical protein
VRAWWQIQQLALKKERLALDREKVIRSEIEYIVKVCNLPDLREIAEDDELDFTQKIRCIRKILHGEPKEQTVVETLTGGKVESENAANIQHSIPHGGTQHSIGAEAPTPKLQAPEKNQTSNTAADSQPSTNNPQPAENLQPLEAAGSLSCEEATEFLTAVHSRARQIGLRLPKPWHVASLRAYLTGEQTLWLNPRNLTKEPVPPPAFDPRLDPESPWSRLWKNLEAATNQNANN